jgi:penicillin-binding protein 1C
VKPGARLALAALLLAGVAPLLPRAAAHWPSGEPPSLERLRAAHRRSDAVLLDRHGAVLHELRTDPDGRRLDWTPLAEISPALRDAVVRVEDHRFWEHAGVDLRAAAGASFDALRGARARGASTLTMQLAALLDPALRTPAGGRGVTQKWRQARAAWALERTLAKDEILEAYLNLATFRGELQGVAAAARGLFGKEPHGLDGTEAWLLAALLRSPNATAADAAGRACALVARARDAGSAGSSSADADCVALAARAESALAGPARVRAAVALAPHVAARLLRAPGAVGRVTTTLDASLQRVVTALLREQLLSVRDQNARDGAVLVADNATGEVLAWVGSSGPLSAAPEVDGVRARRQAGSTLKPFLYARAFDARILTARTRLLDAPLDVPTAAGAYRPDNYDHRFQGLVPAREALASSRNVPAVRLLQQLGVEELARTLARLGFRDLGRPDFYGESLALGTADVTLLELVTAYRALANGGVSSPLRLLPEDGPTPEGERVLSAEAAFLVADILADRASRAGGFGLENVLATRFWSAVKTGTSKDMRDNWCVGFTRDFTVGVWVGNASGAPMWNVSGVEGAAPVWHAVVSWLQRDRPAPPPDPPAGLVRADGEWYLRGTEPAAVAPGPRLDAALPSRIASPAEGTIVAIDPDIPRGRERIALRADPPAGDLRFELDGRPLGPAATPVLWAPERGRHELLLVDANGATLDRVAFDVR